MPNASSLKEFDVVIIGGGPAGLCAAINGASEGLRVAILDTQASLGGQAKESYRIENYPLPLGHAEGVTGEALMAGFAYQAARFGAKIHVPCRAVRLELDANDPRWKIVTTDDFQQFRAKCVLISTGLSYRRLEAEDIGKFMGRGVYYGVPGVFRKFKRKTVGIVGAANSAGQAALRVAETATHVVIFARGALTKSMSTYLIERIRATKNILVMEGVEITKCRGTNWLEGVQLTGDDDGTLPLDLLFIYIGAIPHTAWLLGTLELNEHRFILTDADLDPARGPLHPCETSMPGVFAAGDVRYGQAVKRITGAIGDGITALQSCHRFCSSISWCK